MTLHTKSMTTTLVAVFAVVTMAMATPALADRSHRGHDRGHDRGHVDVRFVYGSCGTPYVSYRYGHDRGYRFNRRFHRGGYHGYSGRYGYGSRYLRHGDGSRGHRGYTDHRGQRRERGHRDGSRYGRRYR